MRLNNTLTREVDELKPLEDGKIRLYTCGLTVYSQPHIGNWLPYIYWDVLVRTLSAAGYKVEHTQNITDVGHLTSDDDNGEDKMEKGAKREGLTAWDIAAKYIDIATAEAKQLGLLEPTHLVRATDMIPQQIDFTKKLDEKGYLYEIPGDGMYFDTSKLVDYGKLAKLNIGGLEAGARVSVEGKKNITDFAVWKFSPNPLNSGQKRDMEWDSPWGIGFPGWHLECSVIARETLGDQIDIHCGGIDHIPVHHTNEIAQTEAVTGKQFSQFWVHNNHLKVDGGKMAKSKGNVYTLQDILDHGYSLDAFKVFALGKHYRTEGNFTWENLEAAANRLRNWQEISDQRWQPIHDEATNEPDKHNILGRFTEALLSDLNTPKALSVIDELVAAVEHDGMTSDHLYTFTKLLQQCSQFLGIDLFGDDISEEQKQSILQREEARRAKDWATSDSVRDTLIKQGIGLRDTPQGAVWYRLRNSNQCERQGSYKLPPGVIASFAVAGLMRSLRSR